LEVFILCDVLCVVTILICLLTLLGNSNIFSYEPKVYWTDWSSCTVTCGVGLSQRTRVCSWGGYQENCTTTRECRTTCGSLRML